MLERHVRGDDDNDRALLTRIAQGLGHLRGRSPAIGNDEIACSSEIREDEHAQVMIEPREILNTIGQILNARPPYAKTYRGLPGVPLPPPPQPGAPSEGGR